MGEEVTMPLPWLIPVEAPLMGQSHVLLGNMGVGDNRQCWMGTSCSSSSWCDQQASTIHIISNAQQSVPSTPPYVETS